MKRILLVAAVSALGGCAVTPMIDYHALSDRPRKENWVTYQLTDTTIAIGVFGAPSPTPNGGTPSRTTGAGAAGAGGGARGPAASGASPSGGAAAPAANPALPNPVLQPVTRAELAPITLTPITLFCTKDGCQGQSVAASAVGIPYEGLVLALEPRSGRFARTAISPTYFPRSLRLKTLSIEVTDQRKEVIDSLGALGVGLAQLSSPLTSQRSDRPEAEPPPMKLNLPVTIDLSVAKATLGGNPAPLPFNPGWTYSIKFLDNAETAGFLRQSELSTVHGAVLTSLCRPMQITLSSGTTTLLLGVTVADPDYLIATPMPSKGSVIFDDLCGADVQAQAVTDVTTNVLVSDFFQQVQAVRAASGGLPVAPVKTTATSGTSGGASGKPAGTAPASGGGRSGSTTSP